MHPHSTHKQPHNLAHTLRFPCSLQNVTAAFKQASVSITCLAAEVQRGKGRVPVADYSLTAQALPDYNPVTLLNTTAKPMPLPALVSD